jgi:hypothetical protein
MKAANGPPYSLGEDMTINSTSARRIVVLDIQTTVPNRAQPSPKTPAGTEVVTCIKITTDDGMHVIEAVFSSAPERDLLSGFWGAVWPGDVVYGYNIVDLPPHGRQFQCHNQPARQAPHRLRAAASLMGHTCYTVTGTTWTTDADGSSVPGTRASGPDRESCSAISYPPETQDENVGLAIYLIALLIPQTGEHPAPPVVSRLNDARAS